MTNQPDLLTKFHDVRLELESNFLERETAIESSILALLTKEHLLLLGPPGTAKSMLVRCVCLHIRGASYFERLLTRFSTPEELFGPLSLAALEQDRYQRVTSGTMIEAHICFLDEVYKANSAILNSLLGVINERIYHEAGQVNQVPLVSLFGASNETPEDHGLAALHDRFLLRVVVPFLVGDDSIRKLFDLELQPPATILELSDIETAHRDVMSLPLTPDGREALISIKHDLESEGISASDRRWKLCGRLVRAKAWLEGDREVRREHGDVLVNSLWSEPGQIRVVERVVNKVSNPLNLEAVELEDAAMDLYKQRPGFDSPEITRALEPLLRQLSDIHQRLEQRIGSSPSHRTLRARQALQRIEGWHRELSQLALQSLSRLHMAPGVV